MINILSEMIMKSLPIKPMEPDLVQMRHLFLPLYFHLDMRNLSNYNDITIAWIIWSKILLQYHRIHESIKSSNRFSMDIDVNLHDQRMDIVIYLCNRGVWE